MRPKSVYSESDGSLQALDHAANWVRFADTKATILMGALGVVTTLLVSNASTIVVAASKSEVAVVAFVAAAVLTAAAFLITLGWLVNAVVPRRPSDGVLNRFSWPSLLDTDYATLEDHTAVTSSREDALRQALTLAKVADAKFQACGHAGIGFTVFIILAVGMLVAATIIGSA